MADRLPRTLDGLMQTRGEFSRRGFMKSLGIIAATLAIPLDTLYAAYTASLAKTPKLPVIWLQFQDCTGCSESLLRAPEVANIAAPSITDPSIIDLLLDVISVEYNEVVMAPSGFNAEKSRNDVIAKYPGQYVCIVEGAIPTGAYCCVGGRTAQDILTQVSSSAAATIAVGNCASWGGLPGANPNPTGAKGVGGAYSGVKNLVNIPGCPFNVVNLVSTVCYFIAYGALPALDNNKEPRFLSANTVHSNCIRRGNSAASSWNDPLFHKTAPCLKLLGCKGLSTSANCSYVGYNNCNAYCTKAGHGCINCVASGFWDSTFPLFPQR